MGLCLGSRGKPSEAKRTDGSGLWLLLSGRFVHQSSCFVIQFLFPNRLDTLH